MCLLSISSNSLKRFRLVFISNEIAIDIERSLIGKEVPANGNVEFLVRIGDFVICIVEAKKSDFDQGRAQNYVECEVAYEVCCDVACIFDIFRVTNRRCLVKR